MMRGILSVAGAVALWTLVPASAQSVGLPPTLPAASSGTHAWFALGEGGRCRILHHAATMAEGVVREATVLGVVPVALAGSLDQLWVVMPSSGSPPVYEVFSLTTRRNPATGTYFDTPPGRLDVLPSLRSTGVLGEIAADTRGLAGWIEGGAPTLLRLQADRWVEVPLPGNLGGSSTLAALLHEGDRRIALVGIAGKDLTASIEGSADGTPWEQVLFPGSAEGFAMVVPGAASNAVLRRVAGGLHELAYISPSGPRSLATIPIQASPWTVVGLGEKFLLASASAGGEISLSKIDSLTGSIAPPIAMTGEIVRAVEWIHLPVLGGATILLLLLGFVLRPPVEAKGSLATGWEPLPMGRRSIALAIDLLPGVVVALGVTGAPLESLLAMPSWTPELSRCLPSLLMLGVTGGWCALFEIAARATPGKFLVGARIIRAEPAANDSVPPSAHADVRAGLARSAARAALKAIVLLAPALGVLAFVHPLQQGVPETITGTAVARKIARH